MVACFCFLPTNKSPTVGKDVQEYVDQLCDDWDYAEGFNFDGVTAGLQVNERIHAFLLCVTNVDDIASGDLSLPSVSN